MKKHWIIWVILIVVVSVLGLAALVYVSLRYWGKAPWDWLELLVVPVVLATGRRVVQRPGAQG